MAEKIDKWTIVTIVACVIVVGIAVYAAMGGNVFGATQITSSGISENSDGLSGQVLELDANRGMAGAPCHFMAGQYMGDCQIREIEFEAWRYDWSEPTITVKTGEIVRIKGTSRDVNHGIAIPQANFNLLLEPGKTSVGEFVAPAPGTYDYGCSVNCGPGHHNHRGKLIVVE